MPDDETFALTLRDDEESIGALAALQRGLIISGYAHVEFVLTDFFIRCSNIEEYKDLLPENLPYAMEKRLNCLRAIFSAEGPLARYASKMLPLVDQLLLYANLRHMMSHGLMVLHYDNSCPGNSCLTFRRYDFGKNKTLLHYVAEITLESLSKEQLKITRYSHEVVSNIWNILRESGLPAPPGAVP